MIGSTHMIIGFGTGMIVSSGAGLPHAVAGGCLGAVVALLPDIDHPNSRVSHALGIFALPFRLIPHRTTTHAIWIPLLLGGLYFTYPYWLTATVAIAYTSHILADMITPRGVPLFYPLSRRAWGLGLIRTGGILERVLALVLLLGILTFWGILA